MDKFLETTKSFSAFTAFSAIIALTVIGVTALNPVPNLTLASEQQEVAGLQFAQAQPGNIALKSVSGQIIQLQNTAEFTIQPGQTSVVAGEVTLTNLQDTPSYAYVSAVMPSDLTKVVRVELIDSDNKIILSDFTKDFEKQKLTFNNQATRTFKVRYILKSPLNYASKVSLLIK